MLRVAAFEFGDPVLLLVLMKSDDAALHDYGVPFNSGRSRVMRSVTRGYPMRLPSRKEVGRIPVLEPEAARKARVLRARADVHAA